MMACVSKKQPILSIYFVVEGYVIVTSIAYQMFKKIQLLFFMITTPPLPYPKIICFTKGTNILTQAFTFIQEFVNNGDILIYLCGSGDHLAKTFTKPVSRCLTIIFVFPFIII